MFNKDALRVFLDKVPALRNPWNVLLTVLYVVVLALLCALLVSTVDSLGPYAPLASQLALALLTALVSYLHFRLAGWYRRRYGSLAYQSFFYHLVLPYLVAWYACVFHPLFIAGPDLLPTWLSLVLGVLFLSLCPIVALHIERAGFHMETHGLDLYTIFTEETTVVRGEIYAYIRHPLYLALTCCTFGLAFLANNWIALTAGALQLIPALAAGWLEDRELIERDGEAQRKYIEETGALLPRKQVPGFLRLLFVGLFLPDSQPSP